MPPTPRELGEHLARLVWETFTDLLIDAEVSDLLIRLGGESEPGRPTASSVRELLVYVMWAHTRGVQQAFLEGSATTAARALDEMHRLVYRDLSDWGAQRSTLPLFEQVVAARYEELNKEAGQGDIAVGAACAKALGGGEAVKDEDAQVLASVALAVAAPMRDYYKGVRLIDEDADRAS